MYGIIKFFNEVKGYGFIQTSEGDYFFHVSHLVEGGDKPVIENKVRFDVAPAIAIGKKPQAINVQVVHDKSVAAGFTGAESDGGAQ